ncbi:MAG: hypothetical protein HKO07_00035, partial [Pseudomonadales bacterium]|nr:hypothetical protein [Pseudomonadales bacterium]
MQKSDRLEKNLAALAQLSNEEKVAAFDKAGFAVANFSGSLEELEKALGMLIIGYHFGWKVLLLVHSKRTIRKYEKILEIDIKEFFPAEGSSANRSMGLDLAKQIGNFWQVVSGDIKVDNRRDIEDAEQGGSAPKHGDKKPGDNKP